jgi:acetolactate synthase-1/2/3 large subunit
VADITEFAAANGLPVCTAFRNQDRFDNYHDNYVGEVGIGANPLLAKCLKETDLFIALGPRLGEQTSQNYTLLDIPVPQQPLVHIHAGVEELGRVYQPILAINAGMPQFAAAAAGMDAVDPSPWADWLKDLRAAYQANLEIHDTVGALDMAEVVRVLRDKLPKDAIIANDAGNSTGWAHRYLPFSTYPSQVGPTSGSMGYGVPAALSAALIYPDRTTICFVGDGGFLMSGNELASAQQYGLKPIFLVVNNGTYGTIKMHQAREYPDRYPATELQNPDFAAYAQSFGCFGEVVEKSEDFAAAFERAMAADKCAVLELRTDIEAITPRATLSQIKEAGLARRKA